MSTLVDPGRLRAPSTGPVPGPPRRPRLIVVPRARQRWTRIPFALVVVLALGIGVVGLLVVNTSLQQSAFAVARLESRATALLASQQSLQLEVSALRDPGRLARRAQQLGMVADPTPVFLRLSDGRVVGSRTGRANAAGIR